MFNVTTIHSKRAKKTLILGLVFTFLMLPLAACSKTPTIDPITLFGSYGKDTAAKISTDTPRRLAGSAEEKAAANYIKAELEGMGYRPELQEVPVPNGVSSNVVVKIPGNGFIAVEKDLEDLNSNIYQRKAKAEDGQFRREVIVAARMDTEPKAAPESDGISDNSSGLAALLLLAKQLRKAPVGYDVTLAALGGGFADNAGAKVLLGKYDAKALASLDCFYEFRSLYSGGKLYASSGWSSLYPNMKYAMRQPLYSLTEVALNESIVQRTGVNLYQNQATFMVPNPLAGQPVPAGATAPPDQVVFHEISLYPSDYRTFDQVGVPCVILESFDYDANAMDQLKENVGPNFASVNYQVRGSALENQKSLREFLGEDELKNRINAAVLIVWKTIEKGVFGARNY